METPNESKLLLVSLTPPSSCRITILFSPESVSHYNPVEFEIRLFLGIADHVIVIVTRVYSLLKLEMARKVKTTCL